MVLKSFLKPIAVAALLAAAGSSHAVITVYTTQASFLAAVSAPATNTFSSIQTGTPIGVSMAMTAGSYGFTAAVGSASQLYGASVAGNAALSTNANDDVITLNAFTGGVRGVGGNFFTTDIDGNYLIGNITLTATDASGTITRTISSSTTSSFLGFVSSTGLSQLTVASVTPTGLTPDVWPTVDNLTLAAAVPEPQTYALLFAGLGVIGFMARRRRS